MSTQLMLNCDYIHTDWMEVALHEMGYGVTFAAMEEGRYTQVVYELEKAKLIYAHLGELIAQIENEVAK